MIEHKVITTLKNNPDGTQSVNISFEPGIAGENSEEFAGMSEEQRDLQNAAAHIGNYVIQSLSRHQLDNDEFDEDDLELL